MADVTDPVCVRCKAVDTLNGRGKCNKCNAYNSPFSDQPDMWIAPPAKWTGRDAERYAAALKGTESYQSAALTNFTIAMAIAEDWNIPALSGNPDSWNFSDLDLPLVVWAGTMITADYLSCFEIPKNFYAPSPNGQAARKKAGKQDG